MKPCRRARGVLPREELARRLAAGRAGKTVVFTNGCFDVLHLGHLRALEAARRLGDLLVVGVNSDASVRRLKGPLRPIVPECERAELIAALRPVDYVVIFDEPTAEETIRILRPEVYVKGGDYTLGQIPESAPVRELGGRVEIAPLVPGLSTTRIVQRILSAYGRTPSAA
jgi:D-beta-D-heptose 7-phosphate kinase/D-beta-D-heptose 1-phosphate adenosyltransferase